MDLIDQQGRINQNPLESVNPLKNFQDWKFLIPSSEFQSSINRIYFLIFIKIQPRIEGLDVLDSR
jgi:hypothetical protein